MPLTAGDKLGPYEILAPIGAGGMGEVYRARDPRLNRDVAIKVSSAQFSERFEREAKAIAALNHPNICHLYDVGPNYLVMEYIEGEAPQGPLPLEEVLRITRQIADALEAAHEKGITHRDLKPGNIKIKPDGTVKVLDFGLAKIEAVSGVSQSENSPTLSMAATQMGVILGTAGYMSPEQARGKAVDKRADIWAFGVVFYELLTGKRLFQGEDVSHTMAAVIMQEPNLDVVPVQVRKLLQRCLEKDPKKRLRDISGVELLLDSGVDSPRPEATPVVSAPRRILPWVAAGVFATGLAALAFLHFRENPPEQRSMRFQMPAPEKSVFNTFKLSPDGRYLAFAGNEGGRRRLWVRPLDSLDARALAGTEDMVNNFVWSFDSDFIAFAVSGKLKKVSVAGGPPQTLCDAPAFWGGTWNSDGTILFAAGPGGPLRRVSAGGGGPVDVTKPGPGEGHFYPEFLPDGQHFLYRVAGGKPETAGVYVGSLDGAAPARLLPDDSNAVYVPPAAAAPGKARNGHLLFRRENTLMAQPFDPEALRLTGGMFPLAEPVGGSGPQGHGAFSASANGVLAYGPGAQSLAGEPVWMDRAGKQLESAGPAGQYGDIRLSSDEKKIVFSRLEASNQDIWVRDIQRGVTSRLTFDPGNDNLPIWSSDGLRVLWSSNRGGGFDLYSKTATGTGLEELLIKMGTTNGWATDWSRDGRFVLYQMPGINSGQDLWIAPQSSERASGDKKPSPYLQAPYNEQNGVFSPDGHWIAYESNESGHFEVYVQSFPLSGGKWQISTGGGTDAEWRKDGAELFYLAADRNLMGLPVRAVGTNFEPGMAKPLFPVPGNVIRRAYAPSGDGRRFLVTKPVDEAAAVPVTVVLNWQVGLKK